MKETKNTLLEQNELTEKELDVITTVFRSYETGLREATIHPKVGKLYLNFHRLLILVSLKYYIIIICLQEGLVIDRQQQTII